MSPRLLLKNIVTKGTILAVYSPVVLYIYGYVIYKGIKSYSKHMTKS